jgi:ribosomal protein S12 methylthiotransferase
MIKVGLVSLGCAKNLIDSEMILAMFDREKFQLTDDPKDADLIIVNTCGFIASAKKESIDTILEMAQYHAKVAVVGCLAERYYEELKSSLSEADLIVPIRDYQDLPALLSHLVDSDGIAPAQPLQTGRLDSRIIRRTFGSAKAAIIIVLSARFPIFGAISSPVLLMRSSLKRSS